MKRKLTRYECHFHILKLNVCVGCETAYAIGNYHRQA